MISLNECVKLGCCSRPMANNLKRWIRSGMSVFIVGKEGAGKTTLANALSLESCEGMRALWVSQAREVAERSGLLFAQYDTRQQKLFNSYRDFFMRYCMRLRPDWFVTDDVPAWTTAVATLMGYERSIATMTALNHKTAIGDLIKQAEEFYGDTISHKELVYHAISNNVIFVTVARFPEDGSRRITGIYEVPKGLQEDGSFKSIPLWEWETTEVLPRDKDGNRKVVGRWVKRNELSEVKRLLDTHSRP